MTFVQQIIPGKIKGRRGFLFYFFFSPELLEEMFVTFLSQIGFASDLEVLCQKLLIDHWRDNRPPFTVLSTLEYLPLLFVTDSSFLSSSGDGQIKRQSWSLCFPPDYCAQAHSQLCQIVLLLHLGYFSPEEGGRGNCVKISFSGDFFFSLSLKP